MPDSVQTDNLPFGRLHVLTDFHFQQRFSHAHLAELAIAGGADVIQFRQKLGSIRHVLHEARCVGNVCRASNTPVLINDRLDVALAVEADGVHIGQNDIPIGDAKRLMGPSRVVGATASTLHEAQRAEEEGADYVGFGPVFQTRSKANPTAVRGLEALAQVCEGISIPVIAIAGITSANVSLVLQAGAYGVAVMTAVSCAEDPLSSTRQLREAIDSHFYGS